MRLVHRLGAASLCLLLSGPIASRAAEPGVHAEILNGAVRVTLEGSYTGSRYTVLRSEGPNEPARILGQRDALCTGDCYAMDDDALVGGTYWYRFDVTSADGVLRQFGPVAVTIGGPAIGLKVAPAPNPLRDRGTLRVTAAIPAGERAGNPGRATGLPGDVSLVDMSGRTVRTLWSGTLDRLTFDVPFVARDSRGQALPPGLYFVVVRAGTHRSISRVAVVR
ncbi:MAG TPA: hypothetical protein VFX50_17010 [Gemmatimonadales bacterium]|nr:hypothetical protein [Gemmatimonadales bacterium]